MRSGVAPVLLVLCCVLSYFNSLQGLFTFDDHLALEGNRDVRCSISPSTAESGFLDILLDLEGGPLRSKFFLHDFWGKNLDDIASHRSYRPLTVLSFRLNACLSVALSRAGWTPPPLLVGGDSTSLSAASEGFSSDVDRRPTSWTTAVWHPFTFHLVNILLHATVTIQLFWIFKTLVRMFQGSGESKSTVKVAESQLLQPLTVFSAAALFAVHPIHTEAVSSIVGRAEPLSAVFSLKLLQETCLLLEEVLLNSPNPLRVSLVSLLLHAAKSALFLVCSVLSKDSGVTVTAFAVLIVVFAVSARVTLISPGAQLPPGTVRTATFLVALYVALAVTSLVSRAMLIPEVDLASSPLLRKAENPQHFIVDPVQKAVFLGWMQVMNVKLLFAPWPLCAEYSYKCIEDFQDSAPFLNAKNALAAWTQKDFSAVGGMLQQGINADPRIIAILLLLILLIAVATRLAVDLGAIFLRYKSAARTIVISPSDDEASTKRWVAIRRRLLLYLFLGIGAVAYLPVSHLLVTVGTLLAERCLYLPSIAACFTYAYCIEGVAHQLSALCNASHRWRQRMPLVLLLPLLVTGCLLCLWRSEDWLDDSRLFESSVRVCSTSAKHHQQLALLLLNQGRTDRAEQMLKIADRLDPEYCEPRWHLARIRAKDGHLEEALKLLRQCLGCQNAAHHCLPLWKELRRMKPDSRISAFPAQLQKSIRYTMDALEAAEAYLDLVVAAKSKPEASLAYAGAASQYRQVGLSLRNLAPTKPRTMRPHPTCVAALMFGHSHAIRLLTNSTGSLLQAEDELDAEKGAALEESGLKRSKDKDDTYCNNLYWLAQSMLDCAQHEAYAYESAQAGAGKKPREKARDPFADFLESAMTNPSALRYPRSKPPVGTRFYFGLSPASQQLQRGFVEALPFCWETTIRQPKQSIGCVTRLLLELLVDLAEDDFCWADGNASGMQSMQAVFTQIAPAMLTPDAEGAPLSPESALRQALQRFDAVNLKHYLPTYKVALFKFSSRFFLKLMEQQRALPLSQTAQVNPYAELITFAASLVAQLGQGLLPSVPASPEILGKASLPDLGEFRLVTQRNLTSLLHREQKHGGGFPTVEDWLRFVVDMVTGPLENLRNAERISSDGVPKWETKVFRCDLSFLYSTTLFFSEQEFQKKSLSGKGSATGRTAEFDRLKTEAIKFARRVLESTGTKQDAGDLELLPDLLKSLLPFCARGMGCRKEIEGYCQGILRQFQKK